MSRIFKYGDIVNITFTPDKELNILIYRSRPVEIQFGARGNYAHGAPVPLFPSAGCLAPESNILCRQWSFGKYSSLYSRGKFRL